MPKPRFLSKNLPLYVYIIITLCVKCQYLITKSEDGPVIILMRYNDLIERLQNLIGFKPTQQALADILGVRQSAIGNRVSRNSNFSDDEIELLESHYAIDIKNNNDCIKIDYIHITPSCGRGTVVLEEPEVTPVKIGREIIRDLWHVPDASSLKLFKASGDSMEEVIEDGNLLLVDTSRTDFANGGIFIITINNDWFVKRLRLRVTGELDIISDNPKYPIETVLPHDNVEIKVMGRVIKNLSKGL